MTSTMENIRIQHTNTLAFFSNKTKYPRSLENFFYKSCVIHKTENFCFIQHLPLDTLIDHNFDYDTPYELKTTYSYINNKLEHTYGLLAGTRIKHADDEILSIMQAVSCYMDSTDISNTTQYELHDDYSKRLFMYDTLYFPGNKKINGFRNINSQFKRLYKDTLLNMSELPILQITLKPGDLTLISFVGLPYAFYFTNTLNDDNSKLGLRLP